MSRNTIDTNEYFQSLVLNDKRREQLFADMMNTLYKAPGKSILNASGSRGEAIQDTASISYEHRNIGGMGYYCDSSQKGMNVHSCIATTESGTALGMVYQETRTREKQKK